VHSTGDNVTYRDTDEHFTQGPPQMHSLSAVDKCLEIYESIYHISHYYICPLLIVFGIVGNGLLCIALRRDKSTNQANRALMLSLAIADLFACIVPGIEFVGIDWLSQLDAHDKLQTRVMFYRFFHPLWIVALINSTYFTFVLAIMRYIAVCRPFEAVKIGNMKFAKQSIVCVVLLSCTGLIWYGNWGHTTYGYTLPATQSILILYRFGPFHRSTILGTVYHNGFLVIIRMIIPCIILSYTSIQLLRALHSARKMRASMANADDATQIAMAKAEQSLSKCFLAIILLLLLAVISDFIINIGGTLQVTGMADCIITRIGYVISETLVIINNCANILIYCLSREKLRRIIWNILTCKKTVDGESSTISNTSNLSLTARETVSNRVQNA